MGSTSLTVAFLLALLAYGYKLLIFDAEKLHAHVEGSVAAGFEKVREAFRANFEEGWERGGGAFVVYHKGVKVVDLWGGYADKESGRLWKEDTMNVAFSSTKAVAAVCVAHLVDKGRLGWNDLVSKHWPAFAKNGKENITVRWIMQHRAGLAFTDEPIDYATSQNPEAMARRFEDQTPHWPAGTAIGYHALTYGWLVDQLVRKTDEKHRSVGQYFREEIAEKHGLEFYIGMPKTLSYRVTRLKQPTLMQTLEEYLHAPDRINLPWIVKQIVTGGMLLKVSRNVPFLNGGLSDVKVNNPDLYPLEQAAALGIGVPRDLALLFEKVRKGEIVSARVLKDLTSDYVQEQDIITGANVGRGLGWIVMDVERKGGKKEGEEDRKKPKLFGHAGLGGQNVRIDLENEISLAYMSNHLKVGLGDTARTYLRLLDALYDSVEALSP